MFFFFYKNGRKKKSKKPIDTFDERIANRPTLPDPLGVLTMNNRKKTPKKGGKSEGIDNESVFDAVYTGERVKNEY